MIPVTLFLSAIWAQQSTLDTWQRHEAVLKLSVDRVAVERPLDLHRLNSALVDLAAFLTARGRYRDAEMLYLRSQSINENLFGPSSLEVARSLMQIGNIYHAELRFKDAEAASRKAVELLQSLTGSDSLDSAYATANLAVALADQGQYARAEPVLRRSLFLIRTRGPKSDPKAILTIEENLAMVYLRQGEFRRAEPLLLTVVEKIESGEPLDPLAAANAYAGLAELYTAEHRWTEAGVQIDQAYGIAVASQIADHSSVAGILHIKASVEAHSGNLREAALNMKRCIELLETSLRLATMLDDDAVILRRLGQNARGRAEHRRAEAIRRAANKE